MSEWPLPDGLQELELSTEFNRDVSGWRLPSQLRSLTFGSAFTQSVLGLTLPPRMTTVRFRARSAWHPDPLAGWLIPPSMRTIEFDHELPFADRYAEFMSEYL
jgi:hypothetical protein